MTFARVDIAIIGAGIAGASLAAAIGARARVALIEAEAQPGYHATGRSAAFWSESYGGPWVQPLSRASGRWLEEGGFLRPRGCIYLAVDGAGDAALDTLAADFAGSGLGLAPLDRAGLERAIPGLAPHVVRGLAEPGCRDIDVAALHAHYLAAARRAGVQQIVSGEVGEIARDGAGWRLATRHGAVAARVVVDAAGAWAGAVAARAGATPIRIQPYRRTIAQLVVAPSPPVDMPLVIDACGTFYFKPEAGGRLWLSPHDETPVAAQDVAAEELDVATAIDRLERVVDWRILRRERAWAGLRSFAPDRLPVYGFDARAPGFFWFAGQGGFGIQTAPAAADLGAALVLGDPLSASLAGVDPDRYAPARFAG